jgi:hypothetical protein
MKKILICILLLCACGHKNKMKSQDECKGGPDFIVCSDERKHEVAHSGMNIYCCCAGEHGYTALDKYNNILVGCVKDIK